MFNISAGVKKDPPRTCHPWIAFRGAIKKEGKDFPFPEPTLKFFTRYSNLPGQQSTILGRSVDDVVGLKEALFYEEDFAPRKIWLWNGFLNRKADVANRKFLCYHPNGFGRNSSWGRLLLFKNDPVPGQPYLPA